MSLRTVILSVSGPQHGMPLLDFLMRRLSLSSNKAKALLDDRLVFVNGRRVWMARHPVAVGDKLQIMRPVAEPDKPKAGAEIPVLWSDEHYLVINKPVGLLAEGRGGVEGKLSGENRVWAVHRLDRDSTGCLLLAREAEGREAMIPLFAARAVEKVYHAVVCGRFPPHLALIDKPIEHLPAITHIRPLKRGVIASLLELRIETGRTHQIRIHLSDAGHPVVGDKEYTARGETPPELRTVPRQLLHASRLGFKHPKTGQQVTVDAPWPADFRSWVGRLKLR